jgi:hypothetical protein
MKPGYTVDEYADACVRASKIIQRTPGARGTYLHRKPRRTLGRQGEREPNDTHPRNGGSPRMGCTTRCRGRYAGSMDEEDNGVLTSVPGRLDPAKLARRNTLQALLDNHYRGNRKRLYIAAGLTHGRISQMLTDGFGENSARDLEGQLGLPYRFFEAPPQVHAIDLTPRACLIGALLDTLAHDEARHKATFEGLRSALDEILFATLPSAAPTTPAPAPTPQPRSFARRAESPSVSSAQKTQGT